MTEPTTTALTTTMPAPLAATDVLPLDRNPAVVYLAQLAPGSRRTMREALNTIARMLTDRLDASHLTFPWHLLKYQHTAAIREALSEKYAPATANKHLAALRRTLKEAWRLGLVSAEEYQRAADVQDIKAEQLPRGRALSDGEIVALLSVCAADPTPLGARDAAIIAILRGAGLRRSEIVKLDLSDYDRENNHALTIRSGKGRKDRVVYLPEGAALNLSDWLSVRGDQAGPLFYPIAKGNKLLSRHMSDQAVLLILDARRKAANVKPFSPHDMRRTFISGLLDAGADVVTTQKLAGHKSTDTTAGYDRRGEAAKKRAASLVHVPHFARS